MAHDPKTRHDEQPIEVPPEPLAYAYPAAAAGASRPLYGSVPSTPTTRAPRPDEGLGPGAFSALNFLAGVWLVLAPFALNYDNTGTGFDGYWNDVVVGTAIALVALVRMMSPYGSAAIGAVNVGLGAWLIGAPFILDYNAGANAAAATWNDIIVGAIVLILAAVSVALAQPGSRADKDSSAGA